jgi:hypothetical protein
LSDPMLYLLMKQFSLVAYYGAKPSIMSDLLYKCQELIVASGMASCFVPYQIDQIHATIIGMEIMEGEDKLINRNLFNKTGNKKEIDLSKFDKIVQDSFPMQIQIGGFSPSFKMFLSKGKTPFQRSFHINITSRKIVLMGWPVRNEQLLITLREQMEDTCNIAHKYVGDNDFYMVLGEIDPTQVIDEQDSSGIISRIAHTQSMLQHFLSENRTELELAKENLSLVCYESELLPVDNTRVFPLEIRPYLTTCSFELFFRNSIQ